MEKYIVGHTYQISIKDEDYEVEDYISGKYEYIGEQIFEDEDENYGAGSLHRSYVFSNQDIGRINVFDNNIIVGNNVIIAYYNCAEDKILPWNLKNVGSILNLHNDIIIKVEVLNVSLGKRARKYN